LFRAHDAFSALPTAPPALHSFPTRRSSDLCLAHDYRALPVETTDTGCSATLCIRRRKNKPVMDQVVIIFLWTSIVLYVLFGGADFGAGIIEVVTSKRNRQRTRHTL